MEIREAKQVIEEVPEVEVIEEVPEEEVINPLPSPMEEAATNGGSAAERDADVDDSSVGSPDRKSAEEEEVTADGGNFFISFT